MKHTQIQEQLKFNGKNMFLDLDNTYSNISIEEQSIVEYETSFDYNQD